MQTLRLARPSALYTPRPDLSSPPVKVEEFRVKAHDGLRLTGLRGRRSLELAGFRIRLRLVSEGGQPEIDQKAVAGGVIEYALQFPAGRRLEDRVLDVVRICQLAAAKDGVEPREVQLYSPPGSPNPDEFLIAAELLAAPVEAE
ncbi:MAG: hypothetical protein ACKVXR_01335 [Planctomycetota bacterium]